MDFRLIGNSIKYCLLEGIRDTIFFKCYEEPPLSETYEKISHVGKTEQHKFQIYTQSRILDFDSFSKTDKPVFRDFLRNSRIKAFPQINAIYYDEKVENYCKILDTVPSSNNIVILADIEIFDQICARIESI